MEVEFIEDPQIGCFCQCGQYRQEIHGFAEENTGSGWTKYSGPYPRRRDGITEMDRNNFFEDAAVTPVGMFSYGHRDRRRGRSRLHDNIDQYLPAPLAGCEYRGFDEPGIVVPDARGRIEYHFRMWFNAGPVDTCNGGNEETTWLRLRGAWRNWEVHGYGIVPATA
jgi:hypothetical protein